jgi:hypothetical protein
MNLNTIYVKQLHQHQWTKTSVRLASLQDLEFKGRKETFWASTAMEISYKMYFLHEMHVHFYNARHIIHELRLV